MRGHIRTRCHFWQRMEQRLSGIRRVYIATLFHQEPTLKQQFNNPRTRSLRSQSVGGTQDFFQIFILHKPCYPGHRRQQRRVGKMARRLGLAFHHFALFTQ